MWSAGKQSVYDIEERPFSLYEPIRTTESSSVGMLRSTHIQATPLATVFFGEGNVQALQSQLQAAIRKATGYIIDRQSDEELLIVMRYVYMQSSRNVGGAAEIRRLNHMVLREIVPQVGAGLAQYLAYLRDASTMHMPIARGQATSVKGTKQAELFRGL